MSAKLTGTVLTLLSFCQLSMTCIILDACFPGSGDRQSNQSHFTASLSLYCSSQPPLHLTFCLSSCPAVGLQLQSDLQRFSGSIVLSLSSFFSPFTEFCKWIRKKNVGVKHHGLYFQAKRCNICSYLTLHSRAYLDGSAHIRRPPFTIWVGHVGQTVCGFERKIKKSESEGEREKEMERTQPTEGEHVCGDIRLTLELYLVII